MGWPTDREVVTGHEALAFHFRGDGWLPSSHTLYRSDAIGHHRPFFPDKLAATDLAAALEVLTRQDLGIVHEDLAMTRLHVDNVTTVALDRERRHLYEELYFIRRYAHRALGNRASGELYLLYQRYYLRQLLKWRLGSSRKVYEMHMKGLELLGLRPGPGLVSLAARSPQPHRARRPRSPGYSAHVLHSPGRVRCRSQIPRGGGAR
jgi:hypothetical protein